MIVLLSVEAHDGIPPQIVDTDSASNNISVVEFVVVGDPCSDKSPEGLPGWVRTESGDLLWLST